MKLTINDISYIISESVKRLTEDRLYHCSPSYKTVEDFTRNGLWLSFDEPDDAYGDVVYEYDVDLKGLNIASEDILHQYMLKGHYDRDPEYDEEEMYVDDEATDPYYERWFEWLKRDGYDGYIFQYAGGWWYLYLFDARNARLVSDLSESIVYHGSV